MTDKPRLIEHAFPLKQASLDSVHEKNGLIFSRSTDRVVRGMLSETVVLVLIEKSR